MPVRPFLTLRRGALVAVAALALLLAPLGTSTARAEDGYRYWGYYQRIDNAWQFAQTAPGSTNVEDGSVQGWRYAVAGMTTVRTPRSTPAFNEICGKVRAVDGEKRVAVVVDPGTAEDAPAGSTPPGPPTATCVVAPKDATATQTLQLATSVRTDASGLVCGIDGYPATGCADAVSNITVPASEAPVTPELTDPAGDVSTGAPAWVWGTVGGLVVVLAGAGVLVARRRRA
ncbi:hypothetical protein GA0111570_107111 [Raineyella antarctica]|uniref:MYXO-CTERM domain-containing protein n=1 Tax=Raineyella antarctica TaxID=1577474 RepID=A0A1G6H836_9ACTN|nr:SCO2322 family protein [Raineyella antarctica]SDB90420.1 hypothetical protein GA0111570_107111 [Raineyella antarctica]